MRYGCSSAVVAALIALLAVSSSAYAQGEQSRQVAPRQCFGLPDEATGTDAIVRTLIAAFDQFDVVALGETHQQRLDSDLRIALVRHPDFAKKVPSIVVEFASTTEQAALDRYIRGENIPFAQLAQVWRTTSQAANQVWESPVYPEFFAAVRDVNSRLPADARIRVLGGDPGPGDTRSRETAAVAVLKEQVLQKHGRALMIYGAGHFWRAMEEEQLSMAGPDIGIVRMLEIDYPGRTFAVIPLGGPDPRKAPHPEYQKLDRALKSQLRPVLVSLQRPPFRDYAAEEFLGHTVMICRPSTPASTLTAGDRGAPLGATPPPPPPPPARTGDGGCRSVLKGSRLTLGQMADAAVYFGRDDDATVPGKRAKFE